MPTSDHLPVSELKKLLGEALESVEIGAQYVHYKGRAYVVTGLAIQESTDEVAVLYQDIETKITFVRSLNIWLDHVESGGHTVPRFQGPEPKEQTNLFPE